MSSKPKSPEVGRTKTGRPHKRGTPPRLTHGTRVAFNITCAQCGKDDTLPFVPKQADEILCSTCARERFGDEWDKGRSAKPAEFEFTCVACGAADLLPFWPEDPDEPRLCGPCMRGVQKPIHGRIDGEVIDAKAGVRRKKR